MFRQFLLSTALLSLAGAGGALAQTPTAKAINGTVALEAGFVPDPHTLDIMAGGDRDARDLGGMCRGHVTDSPTLLLDYTEGDYVLFISATASADTTLVVSAPNGIWYCDDDSGGRLNPLLAFDNPASGSYAIWVGTYSSGPQQPATLSISEIAPEGWSSSSPGTATSSGWPDPSLSPHEGEIALSAGFTPDPRTVAVTAGGEIDVFGQGSGCWGYVSAAPDYSVEYTADDYWPLIFRAEASRDTTMVVNAPDGTWHCDDDGAGYPNPQIVFETPDSGRYDVWVGTYSSGVEDAEATLFVTELRSDGVAEEDFYTSEPPDPTLPPSDGQVTLNAGFTPDPHTAAIQAGGSNDPWEAGLGEDCWGYIAVAPNYRIEYTADDRWPLFIRVESDTDTTMVIQDPDGTWHCDDDSAGNFNPMISFDSPQSGTYTVWVGTYMPDGPTADATLLVSEIPYERELEDWEVDSDWPPSGEAPDPSLAPALEPIVINEGFAPDPRRTDVTAGGEGSAWSLDADGCRGYVPLEAHFAVDYGLDGPTGRLVFAARSDIDTTLVIQGPDGEWYCDDDGAGYPNPLLVFDEAEAGRYLVWVGTYGAEPGPAELFVSGEVPE